MKRSNETKKHTTSRLRPIHAVLAAGVLALVTMPLGFATAADGPQATSSAGVTPAKFKQLKQRIARLEARGVGNAAAPTGPAGGDLTGQYPNPTIGPNAVGSTEIIDASVQSADVAQDTLQSNDVAQDTLGAGDLAPNSVGISEIGGDAVGADELKTTYVNVSGGVEVDANQFGDQTATCNGSDQALGGGFSWFHQDAETHMVYSTPDPLVQPNKWAVRGTSEANDNVLYAWVVCVTA